MSAYPLKLKSKTGTAALRRVDPWRSPRVGLTRMEREITAADLIAASTAPAQIAEAQKLAREWKPKPERS